MVSSSSTLTTRAALAPRSLNTIHTPGPQRKLTSYLPTPPSDQKPKRRRIEEDKQPLKRLKLDTASESEESDVELEDDDDVSMEDAWKAPAHSRRNHPFSLYTQRLLCRPNQSRTLARKLCLSTK